MREYAKMRIWKYEKNNMNDIEEMMNFHRGPFRERGRNICNFSHSLEGFCMGRFTFRQNFS
jgi:hypothetical protein